MLMGDLNTDYEKARKKAQKLFINYVVRFLDRWYPANLGKMECGWTRNNKRYHMAVIIEEISDDLQ